MQTSEHTKPQRRIRGLPAPLAFPNLMPALRAYGGFAPRDAARATESLGRIGSLEVRLARTSAEVRGAQRLRYRVFYEEMSAVPDTTVKLARRDIDPFDGICDHLLVLDHDTLQGPAQRPAIVGTYRLLRQNVAERSHGFYSAREFDIGPLLARHNNCAFVELGRSCVLPPYRNKRTVELLWHGIWTYVLQHRLDAMIGCASLEGTGVDAVSMQLAFLHHYARAPEAWRARALPHRYVEMNRLPKRNVDPKAALRLLPPLVKGYLRLGAYFGDGAVIDRQFGTTDVLVILPVAAINARYIDHFGASAERHATEPKAA